MDEISIKQSISINVSAAKVWEAITNFEATKKYMFGCEVFCDWTLGSAIIYSDSKQEILITGKVTSIIEEKILGHTYFSMQWNLKNESKNYLEFLYTLNCTNGHTELELKVSNFGVNLQLVKDMEDDVNYLLRGLKKTAERL